MDVLAPEYFEEPINISHRGYTMTAANGRVEASINAAVFDSDPAALRSLNDAVEARFLGVQLLTHTPFKLSGPAVTRVRLDGSREVALTGQDMISLTDSVDIQIVSGGKVIADSRQARVEQKRDLAERVGTYSATDDLLRRLLRSYDAAVRDPENELLHLYEIREALAGNYLGGGTRRDRRSASLIPIGLASANSATRSHCDRGGTAARVEERCEMLRKVN